MKSLIIIYETNIRYKFYFSDFPYIELGNLWSDQLSEQNKVYVVQTATKVIERCLLMTTDPGDLVLDPTCVRKGTMVYSAISPTPALPVDGEGSGIIPALPVDREGSSLIPALPVDGEGSGLTSTLSVDGEGSGLIPALPVDREGSSLTSTLSGDGEGSGLTSTLSVDGEGVVESNTDVGREEAIPPSTTGGLQGGLASIESLNPGDLVFGHDGKPHRILRVIKKPYCGIMVGIHHIKSAETLWLTADHRVLAKLRPRTLGGSRDWSATPKGYTERQRQLLRESSPAERKLWSVLRGRQLPLSNSPRERGEIMPHANSPREQGEGKMGFKFRRQHPIGPYIADFYSRDAHLVVEIDGSTHFTEESITYDRERDAYMRSFGLDILRFTTTDVEHNLEGVYLAIQNQCRIRTQSMEGAQWIQAGSLVPGDLVFFGVDGQAVQIASVETTFVEEDVYDLEIDDSHSFLTEVCAVHNCGSGTTAYVAEQWGRRWITIDTSRVAIALARTRQSVNSKGWIKRCSR